MIEEILPMISKEIEQVIQFGISSKKAGRVCDSCLFMSTCRGVYFLQKVNYDVLVKSL